MIQWQFGLQVLHIHKLCWHFPISLNCPCLCEHFVTAAVPLDTISSWAEIGQDLHSLTPHQIFFPLDSINKAWVAGYPLIQTLCRMLKRPRPCSERWPLFCDGPAAVPWGGRERHSELEVGLLPVCWLFVNQRLGSFLLATKLSSSSHFKDLVIFNSCIFHEDYRDRCYYNSIHKYALGFV